MSVFRVFLRQVRADLSALLTLAAILFASAGLAAALPQWLNAVDDEAVSYELAEGGEIDDVVVRVDGELVDGTALDAAVAEVVGQLDPPFDDLVGSPLVAARTLGDVPVLGVNGTARPLPPTLPPIFLTPRVLVGADAEMELVDGELPGPATVVAGPWAGAAPPYDTEDDLLTVVDVALSTATADALALATGDVVVTGDGAVPVVLRVSGVFQPRDPGAYPWQRNGDILSPTLLAGGADGALGEAVVNATSLPALLRAQAEVGPYGVTTTIGLPIDVDAITAPVAAELTVAADRMESRPLELALGGRSQPQLDTSVQESLSRFFGQRATARAVGGVGAGGLLVAVVAVLTLAAQLTAERRRASLALARARGGTIRQLAGLAALEAFVVSAAAGAAGWFVGTTLVDGRASSGSVWLVGLLVASATLAAGVIVGWEHRVVGRTERRDLSATRATPRRLAAEGAVIVLAVAGVVLLRRRGLDSSVVDGSVDPFMVLVPVLVALSVAVVVLRLYPVPLKLAERLVAARPGPVGFLGLSRAGRDPSGTATPLVVLLLALSFAVFSSVVAHSIRVEQESTAWTTVGADVRIDANGSNSFGAADDVAAIAAAAGTTPDRVVGVHREDTATVNDIGSAGVDIELYLLDPVAYERFLETWPVPGPDLRRLVDEPAGTAERLPALVSPGFADGVLTGDSPTVPVFLPGVQTTLTSIGTLASFPGLDPDDRWAVARTEDADRVVDLAYAPSVLFVDAPAVDLQAVVDEVTEQQPFASVTGRDAAFAFVRDAPLTGAVQLGFLVSFVVAALYCALAIVLALVVTSAARSRNLSYLRTLGLDDRQARGLVAWEIVPMAAITAVVGIALGVTLPGLVGPAIDLRPFTGGLAAAPLVGDVLTIAALAGGMLLVVVGTTLLVAALNRRTGLGGALRVGEEN